MRRISYSKFSEEDLGIEMEDLLRALADYLLGSGFQDPAGVAVDPYGNVFVADELNGAIKEIVAAGGYSTVLTLSQAVQYPFFIAIEDAAVSNPAAHARTRK